MSSPVLGAVSAVSPARRSLLKSVALPTEHGGWSLTLEPALLGLLVAWSASGLALTAAALLAFVIRTPLKIVLVDRWRHRWLERTALASRIVMVEGIVLVALAAVAVLMREAHFWWPLAIAVPIFALELSYDMRSKGRHLIPEWAGAVAMGAIGASVALAGGESSGTAVALWAIIGARAFAAVPFVRTQLRRARGQPHLRWLSDVAQIVAVAAVVVFWKFGEAPAAAVMAIVVVAMFELVASRISNVSAPFVGAQQVVLGLTVVVTSGLGFIAP